MATGLLYVKYSFNPIWTGIYLGMNHSKTFLFSMDIYQEIF